MPVERSVASPHSYNISPPTPDPKTPLKYHNRISPDSPSPAFPTTPSRPPRSTNNYPLTNSPHPARAPSPITHSAVSSSHPAQLQHNQQPRAHWRMLSQRRACRQQHPHSARRAGAGITRARDNALGREPWCCENFAGFFTGFMVNFEF